MRSPPGAYQRRDAAMDGAATQTNVIAFPRPAASRVEPLEPLEQSSLTPRVIAAILFIGEPATAPEIARLLSERAPSVPTNPREVQALLDGLSDPTIPGGPLFRHAPLGREVGWAFTLALRQILREHGMDLSLRPGVAV